jgi:hypothetical protein
MTGLLLLCTLALGPALVAVLPPSLLPEALRITQRESSAMQRTLCVARALLLALLAVALLQETASALASGLPW